MTTAKNRASRLVTAAALIALTAILGCGGPTALIPTLNDVSDYFITPKDGNTVTIFGYSISGGDLRQYLIDAANNPESLDNSSPDQTTDIAVVDLATLQASVTHTTSDNIDSSYYPDLGSDSNTLTGGIWTATLNDDGTTIALTRSDTGATSTLTPAVTNSYLWFVGLENDRLVVTAVEMSTGDYDAATPDEAANTVDSAPYNYTPPAVKYIVFELNTGEQWTIDVDNAYSALEGVIGDKFIFQSIAPVASDSGPPSANTERVDLATRERVTLQTSSAFVDSSPQRHGSRLIWSASDYSMTDTMTDASQDPSTVQSTKTVWQYDADADTLTKLAEFAGSYDTFVVGINDRVAMVSKSEFSGGPFDTMQNSDDFSSPVPSPAMLLSLLDAKRHDVVSVQEFTTGAKVTLYDRTVKGVDTFLSITPFGIVTADYAAIMDSKTKELIVYTIATGEIRRSKPFDGQ